MGPAFIKDLTGAGHDYYIFCDHLGTPLAYKNTATGQIYVNPVSPWGESLANAPTRGSPYTNQNFALPPDAVFPTAPLGLAGHLHDADTGLIYMHHRYYDPQLGHFLNPDFRAPDLYDPSTFTEPYAYAAGNPMMFWDPDGLKDIVFSVRSTYYGITVDHRVWDALVRSTPVIDGQPLFENPHVPDLIPTEGGGYEYVNEAEYRQRSRTLEAALIKGFKSNAFEHFQAIRGEIGNHLDSLNETDRHSLYGELNAIGVLPYLGADVVGREYAQEIAGFLLPHENQTYFQYGFNKDLETAFLITDIVSFGSAAVSRPVLGLSKTAFTSMARGGRKFAGRIRNFRFPKLNVNWQQGGIIADTMGNPHIAWPKFNLSFSTGGKRAGSSSWPWKRKTASIKELAAGGGNCESCAHKIQEAIGGSIIHIVPDQNIARGAKFIGPVRARSGKLITDNWKEHFAVRIDDMIFDRITGPEGMLIDDYMKLFDWGDALQFNNVVK